MQWYPRLAPSPGARTWGTRLLFRFLFFSEPLSSSSSWHRNPAQCRPWSEHRHRACHLDPSPPIHLRLAVTTLALLWQWREAAAIGHQRGRFVCYRCRIGCGDCVPEQGDKDYQCFQVRLTAGTKQNLVPQILAEIMPKGLRGYLPRTDLRGALLDVHKGT